MIYSPLLSLGEWSRNQWCRRTIGKLSADFPLVRHLEIHPWLQSRYFRIERTAKWGNVIQYGGSSFIITLSQVSADSLNNLGEQQSSLTWVLNPRVDIMKKKRTDHKGATGRVVSPSGYTTNTKPGPAGHRKFRNPSKAWSWNLMHASIMKRGEAFTPVWILFQMCHVSLSHLWRDQRLIVLWST